MRLDAVTLKQLRALRAVAEHGSLSAAAAALGYTTPAIHSQIKGLETAIGAELLIHRGGGGGTQLTPEGEEMLRAAERIDGVLSQAGAQIRARRGGRTGHVALSVVSTAKYFAPHLVRLLHERLPEVEIALRVGNRLTVIDDLDRARCALAIMGRPPRVPAVEAVPIGPHPHGIVVPPGHPLASRGAFDPEDLAQERFLSREPGSGTRILMQRYLDRLDLTDTVETYELDSNETIKQGVIAGLGIAFLSLHTVHRELASGELVALSGHFLPVMRHWYLVHPVERGLDPAARRVADEINAMNGAFLP
ncbi:LysR substrate-binding domain-containing protein [Albidovulum sp.]